MASSNKSKLEFFRIPLNHKSDSDKTFKDFVKEVLLASNVINDEEAFKKLFEHFMNAPEKDFAKNDKLKKVITFIDDSSNNIHFNQKPAFNSAKCTISGVISGGRYSDDSILADVTDKKVSKKLKRENTVLKYYFIFLYLPLDYTEGFAMIHSNNSEDTITNVFRAYVAELFHKGDYKKPTVMKFCPKPFQDEFRKGAVLSSFNFKTTFLNDIVSNDPIIEESGNYDISITITPKNKTLDFANIAGKLMNVFSKRKFSGESQTKELSQFDQTHVSVKNKMTKSTKTFEWNTKDNEFLPVVYLEDRVKMTEDGTPDFDDLKRYCNELFKNSILPEIRPDLYASYID